MVHRAVAVLLVSAGGVVFLLGLAKAALFGLDSPIVPAEFLEDLGLGTMLIGVVIFLIGAKVEGE